MNRLGFNRRKIACFQCKTPFHGWANRSFCSHECRDAFGRSRGKPKVERQLSGAEADAILEAAVRLETAPPWVRHPVADDPRDYVTKGRK